MGCTSSKAVTAAEAEEIALSLASKNQAHTALDSCTGWKKVIVQFSDSIETSCLAGTLWSEEERDIPFAKAFKNLSLSIVELSVVSRDFLEAIDAHHKLLSEILSLQRQHHDILKQLSKQYTEFQSQEQKIHHARFIRQSNSMLDLMPTSYTTNNKAVGPRRKKKALTVDPEDILIDVEEVDQRSYKQCRQRLELLVRQEQTQWEKIDFERETSLPASIHGLFLAQGNFWNQYSRVFEKLKKVCAHYSKAVEESNPGASMKASSMADFYSSGVKNAHRRRLSITANADQAFAAKQQKLLLFQNPETSLEICKRRLKILKRWHHLSHLCVKLWLDLRDVEIEHVRSCLEWLASLSESHWVVRQYSLNVVDEIVVPPAPESQKKFALMLAGWAEAIRYPVSSTEFAFGSTLNLQKPTLVVRNCLQYVERTVFSVHEREKNAYDMVKQLAVMTGKQTLLSLAPKAGASESEAKKMAAKMNSAQAGPASAAAEALRHKLDRTLIENRIFRRTKLIKCQTELWRGLEFSTKFIGTLYIYLGSQHESKLKNDDVFATTMETSIDEESPESQPEQPPTRHGRHASLAVTGSIPTISQSDINTGAHTPKSFLSVRALASTEDPNRITSEETDNPFPTIPTPRQADATLHDVQDYIPPPATSERRKSSRMFLYGVKDTDETAGIMTKKPTIKGKSWSSIDQPPNRKTWAKQSAKVHPDAGETAEFDGISQQDENAFMSQTSLLRSHIEEAKFRRGSAKLDASISAHSFIVSTTILEANSAGDSLDGKTGDITDNTDKIKSSNNDNGQTPPAASSDQLRDSPHSIPATSLNPNSEASPHGSQSWTAGSVILPVLCFTTDSQTTLPKDVPSTSEEEQVATHLDAKMGPVLGESSSNVAAADVPQQEAVAISAVHVTITASTESNATTVQASIRQPSESADENAAITAPFASTATPEPIPIGQVSNTATAESIAVGKPFPKPKKKRKKAKSDTPSSHAKKDAIKPDSAAVSTSAAAAAAAGIIPTIKIQHRKRNDASRKKEKGPPPPPPLNPVHISALVSPSFFVSSASMTSTRMIPIPGDEELQDPYKAQPTAPSISEPFQPSPNSTESTTDSFSVPIVQPVAEPAAKLQSTAPVSQPSAISPEANSLEHSVPGIGLISVAEFRRSSSFQRLTGGGVDVFNGNIPAAINRIPAASFESTRSSLNRRNESETPQRVSLTHEPTDSRRTSGSSIPSRGSRAIDLPMTVEPPQKPKKPSINLFEEPQPNIHRRVSMNTRTRGQLQAGRRLFTPESSRPVSRRGSINGPDALKLRPSLIPIEPATTAVAPVKPPSDGGFFRILKTVTSDTTSSLNSMSAVPRSGATTLDLDVPVSRKTSVKHAKLPPPDPPNQPYPPREGGSPMFTRHGLRDTLTVGSRI
ncbi:hypothetical protein HDU80_007665 [Chytriomyces hyalinus]|nr:hypothetical protein HDU80_007665 [Chytriomyces hyalinus]